MSMLVYQLLPEEPDFHLFCLWTSVVMTAIAYFLSVLVDNVLMCLLGPYHSRVLASSVFNFLRAFSAKEFTSLGAAFNGLLTGDSI